MRGLATTQLEWQAPPLRARLGSVQKLPRAVCRQLTARTSMQIDPGPVRRFRRSSWCRGEIKLEASSEQVAHDMHLRYTLALFKKSADYILSYTEEIGLRARSVQAVTRLISA